MLNSLRNMLSQVIYSPASTGVQKVATPNVSSNNLFANPFLAQTTPSSSTYGVNKPVKGGYFAGYINGKPNIVGRRLFIEA